MRTLTWYGPCQLRHIWTVGLRVLSAGRAQRSVTRLPFLTSRSQYDGIVAADNNTSGTYTVSVQATESLNYRLAAADHLQSMRVEAAAVPSQKRMVRRPGGRGGTSA